MNIAKNKKPNPTVIQRLGKFEDNNIYIKRDDLLPFSFGGNKARKAYYFWEDIRKQQSDCVVTYGSSSSNHCRVIANTAASMKMKCVIVSPNEDEGSTFNLEMMRLFGAEIVRTPISKVRETIDNVVADLTENGHNPYFIAGGGHGALGTQAYVDCYAEIVDYEADNNVEFDYIFHASGTGTTQAGLICGKKLSGRNHAIIGISIARKNPRGQQIILDSVNEYLSSVGEKDGCADDVRFVDDFVSDGYGAYNEHIDRTIKKLLINHGIPLNRTYTGKAFWGMEQYLKQNGIKEKNVLFIHTGGTPLFFDFLKGL